jgi:hypothetical protein
VKQNEPAKYRNHEWISTAIEEPVDPELKTTVHRELSAEDFVLAENQKKNSNRDAQEGEGFGIRQLRID